MVRWGILALSLIFCGAAHAGVITVQNGDFEAPYAITNMGGKGAFSFGAPGWNVTGTAGTHYFYDGAGNYQGAADFGGNRVGFATGSGSSLYQDLGVAITADTDYSVSALFGHRIGLSFGGTFGFIAGGDPTNIIGLVNITDPGSGLWGSQTFELDRSFFADFVGQTLGIVFIGAATQFNLDDVLVEYFKDPNEKVLVNPIPGAAWLFGTALFAGAAARRRRKAAAAA